jgi:hypothetical protein
MSLAGLTDALEAVFVSFPETHRIAAEGIAQAIYDDPPPPSSSDDKIIDADLDTLVTVEETTDNDTIIGKCAGNLVLTIQDVLGLTLQYGTNINEFSIDGTLSGNSDDVIPTEKAVKTYVDNAVISPPIHAIDGSYHTGTLDHSELNDDEPNQHRELNDSNISSTELWSSSKINFQIKVIEGSDTVLPSSSKDVDSVDITAKNTAKWLLQIKYGSNYHSCEILAREKSLTVDFTRFAKIGDYINYTYNITSDGLSMKLRITNNESSSIDVKFLRMNI